MAAAAEEEMNGDSFHVPAISVKRCDRLDALRCILHTILLQRAFADRTKTIDERCTFHRFAYARLRDANVESVLGSIATRGFEAAYGGTEGDDVIVEFGREIVRSRGVFGYFRRVEFVRWERWCVRVDVVADVDDESFTRQMRATILWICETASRKNEDEDRWMPPINGLVRNFTGGYCIRFVSESESVNSL